MALALAAMLDTVGPASAAVYSFTPLGFQNGQNYVSISGISSDGSAVIGDDISLSGNSQAFRWTEGGGMVGLGDLAGGAHGSYAYDVSADGSVIVGWSGIDFETEAFRWTEGGGMVGLGSLPGGNISAAQGVSSDGSVVVGSSYSAGGVQAFRWTEGGGMVGLGRLPGAYSAGATSVSDDGSVVVGQSFSTSNVEAFRWTEGGGMVGLGDLPGGAHGSYAYDVSAGGSVVVGTSYDDSPAGSGQAFRWTEGGGMVGLGRLPGSVNFSVASSVSADGSVIVGNSHGVAFLWTEGGGMQSMRDLLIAGGAAGLEDWTLEFALRISADGRTIVGIGRNPTGQEQAWVATVPEPSSLLLAALGTVALAVVARRPARRSAATRRQAEGRY
jgi:probable HAF family extracellular repeat protein